MSPFRNQFRAAGRDTRDRIHSLRAIKKADVAEPPEGSNHVGLLFNQPPGTAGVPFK